MVREGIKHILHFEPGLEVVGEAGDGVEAVRVAGLLRPDVLVTDLAMPGLGGLDVVRRVAADSPRTGIVVLSMYGGEAYALEAFRLGASAYVLKEAGPRDLISAVAGAAAGRAYVSPPLSLDRIELLSRSRPNAAAAPCAHLTEREREVLKLTAEGLTRSGVAGRLGISPRTAETHLLHVHRKLGIHTRSELTRFAVARGIVTTDAGPVRAGGPNPAAAAAPPTPRQTTAAPRAAGPGPGPARRRRARL
jgi:DNA-binding NarL/FixJ family response regulator